jgi:uncharacterized protein YjcR
MHGPNNKNKMELGNKIDHGIFSILLGFSKIDCDQEIQRKVEKVTMIEIGNIIRAGIMRPVYVTINLKTSISLWR